MGKPLVFDRFADLLFSEGSQTQQIQSGHDTTNLTGTRKAGKRDADAKGNLWKLAARMVTDELFGKHDLGVAQEYESVVISFPLVEGRIRFNWTAMSALITLELVGKVNGLLVLVAIVTCKHAVIRKIFSDNFDIAELAGHLK